MLRFLTAGESHGRALMVIVEGLPAGSPLEDPLPDDALYGPITPTPHWYHPNYWWGEDPWTAGVELGINGSEGNNNTFSMRTGGHAKRETDRWKIDSSLSAAIPVPLS